MKPSSFICLNLKLKIEIAVKNSEENFATIIECLNNTAASGNYCVDGVAYELPKLSTGLEVANFGKVKLPLEDGQARELIKVCQLAPFGKDELTLYDKNVRDSYQLDPSQVIINSRTWDTKLEHLVKRVGKALGCRDEIQVGFFFRFYFILFK